MEDSFNTLLKFLEIILGLSQANPTFVGITVLASGLLYGYLRYKLKKFEEERILRELEEARNENIDELEEDAHNSNESIRDRLRQRKQ